jgi:hypothetical protein
MRHKMLAALGLLCSATGFLGSLAGDIVAWFRAKRT